MLACGPAALLSHASAAALWGLRPTSRALIDVTAASATKRSGLTVHRARHLSDDDRSERHGIPVTAIPRTLLASPPSCPPAASNGPGRRPTASGSSMYAR